MKWITFSIAFFLLTASSFAQGHFVSSYDANAPDYMNVNVIEATINGLVLEAGDEIAIFDGTLCCAKVIISVPIVYPSTSETLKVSTSYATPPNGYTPGHTITYKFWDSSNLLEISGITAQYVDISGNQVATPTFTDGESAFVKLSVTVTPNQTPVANAGTDQTVNEGVVVTLDGSASSDPDNNSLTYLWTAPTGITLSSATVAKPTFTTPEVSVNTNYTFSLIVNDGKINSAADQVVINVLNCSPTAPTVGTITQPTCALATGSVVLNGLPATGTWTLTKSPGGTTTTGSGTSSTISSLAAGTYTFTVTNASGCISPASANVVVNAQPTTPTAPTVGTITQPTCAVATGSVVLNGLPATGTWTLTKSPGGTTTTGSGTSSTISSLAAGTYTFTVTNASGCISPASANVVVNAQPAIPTAPTVGTITQPTCAVATGSVVLNGLPATGTWTLTKSPGGTTTTGSGSSSTISALAAGTYTFTVTNASGCISPASANVVVNAQATTPTAPTVGTITQPTCAVATGSVVLNGLPATGTWTLTKSPGGATTTGSGTSSTISALAEGTYTFTVTNASGCISPASANVVINAQPATPTAPTVGTITQPTCAVATGSVVLNGLPSTGTWTLTKSPGGTTTTGSGSSSTISALAAGTYTFTVTNASGCISPASANVVVNAQPTTPTAPTVGTITQPTCALATGSVVLNGLPATGTWTLTKSPGGTTTTGSGTSSTISALAAGTYTFTVTNSSGCISPASANVVINAQPTTPTAPTLGTITQPTCAVATGSVVLNGLPATGTWTLTKSPGGTTTTGSGTSSTISALAAGTYTFTVTNASGCVSPASVNVVVNAQPTTPTAPTVGTITQPTCAVATGSVVLNGLPPTGTWTLTKSPGGTTTTGSGTSSTISALAAGTYTFTVTNASGCISPASANVVVNAQPTTPTAPTVGTITQPTCAVAAGSVVLNGLPATETWTLTKSPGETTTTGSGTSSTISALAAGTYTFTVTNASGCVSPASVNVVVNAQPATPTAPTVGTITQPTISLTTGSVVLNGLPASGTWTLTKSPGGTTTTGTGTSATISSLTPGTYTYTVTNASGCISSASANVFINAQPLANAGIDQIVNEGVMATLDGSASSDTDNNTLTYSWTAPSGITLSSTTSQKPTFITPEVMTDQNYTFSLIVNDGIVNSAADQVIITVKQVNKAPIANAGVDQMVNEGAVVTLDGSASSDPDNNTLTYKWTAPTGITLSSTTVAKPTFTAPDVMTDHNYTFSLIVNDGKINSTTDQVIITVKQVNKVPVALAGTDQTLNEGVVATLDGSASSDPDNNTLTYSWTAPTGITLSSTTAAKPTFTAPEVMTDQNYTFSLIVNDGIVNSIADQVIITVKQVNKAPIANAGSDQTVNEGVMVTLDGSASSDPDNNTITYTWTAPTGITLSSTTAAKPTFTAPEVMTDQTYTLSLIVNDGIVNSTADQVIIVVKQVNKAPMANAGADQTVNEGVVVTLDGSVSSDPDNNTITYKWTAPTGITLSSTTVAKPTFTAPEVITDQNYSFSLIVNDGIVNSAADQVIITVKQVNKVPVANAGADQIVNEGVVVTLDGSASSDQDNNTLTYTWTAPSGITLSSTTAAKPTFTAPEVMTNQNYTFSLIVNDGIVNSIADQVFISVKQVNKAPVANAGPDQSVEKNTLYTLDGSASADPDGDVLTYLWTAPAGITLSSNFVARPTFTTPATITPANYTFTLTVSDSKLNSVSDQVVITLKQSNQAPTAQAGIDQSIDEGVLVTLDATASSDPDGDALIYSWIAPSGITLSSATASKPTFIAPEILTNQNYTFTLIVNDGTVNSIADQVIITVRQVNKAPVANAGADQSVIEGSIVALNGSASYDPDNSNISYYWTAPPGITLSSSTIINPKFTAPNSPTDLNYTISLIVNDGTVNSSADQVIITVKHINSSPVANAGSNQTVTEGTFVTLDGSASSDPENNKLTYSWSVPNGITLSSTTVAKPTFIAPEVMTDQNYTFSLIVSDGTTNSIAEVIVTVKQVNKAPVANAGPDQTVNEGMEVTLDGSASSDPDNNTLTYKWTAPAGITLSSTTIAKPTFIAPEVLTDQSYAFSLTVNDGTVNSTTDQLFITVRQINKAPVLTSNKSYTVYEDTPQEFLFEGSDAENDPINFSIENLPSFLRLIKKTNTSAILSGTFTNQYVGTNTFNLNLSDGISTTKETITILVTNVDDAPYVKDSIKNVSVNKGTSDMVIDLKTVFADDDQGDLLSFSVASNTNDKIVTTKIAGTDLTLSFSKEITGLSQIIIKASSNGKEAQSKFNVEVSIPTGIDPINDDAEVSVYPNPTEGDLHIKFEKIPEYGTWINIYNESGRLIIKSLIRNSEEILKLDGNVPGVYFIQIAQKKPKTYKVILK